MNEKGSGLIIGIVIIAVVALIVVAMALMGFLPLSFGGTNGSQDQDDMSEPLGSEYCGYATGDIIGMWENLAGKNLNSDVGYTVVNALSMEACGTNDELPSDIMTEYITAFSTGWYILVDDTNTSGSGYYYRSILWGNEQTLADSTLVRGVISGHGVTIKEYYGYSTITITSFGTRSGYLAFALWLAS